MKTRNLFAMAAVVVLAASCGENSSNKTDDSDTVIATTVDPVPAAPVIDVPEPTQTAFKTKYPTATNVTWSRYEPMDDFDWTWTGWPTLDSTDYYVRYSMDGNDYWTWYDNDVWVGTVTTLPNPSNLPAAVNSTVNANFPGYTITSVKQENDKDRTAYEIKLEKGNDKGKLLVAEDGTVIKKVSTVDGEKTKTKM